MRENPYQTLGIKNNASLSDIKAAYRVLVKKYHPDAGGDQEKIVAINAAWETLKNKNNRDEYHKQEKKSEREQTNYKVPNKHGLNQDQAIQAGRLNLKVNP